VNIQEYISSGIVESYVLGLANEAERAEFEQMCSLHPEVLAARETFETGLERHALADTVAPPAMLRQSILNQLTVEQAVQTNAYDAPQQQTHKPVVVSMAMRYVAAAAIVLLAGSAVLNFYYFNKYREYSRRYDRLLAQQTELVKNNNSLQTKLNTYENTIAGLTNPRMAMIKMDANAVPANGSPAPASIATVYWDTQTKDVYVVANNLPQPGPGKQYQLWAIVDGQPVDAGVFDLADNVMVKLKNIPRAQLFAITLEQQGGSPTPKGPMYVLGKV
jgi:anti-sigma-K factor RskA